MIVIVNRSFPFEGEPFLAIEQKYMDEDVIFFPEKGLSDKKNEGVKQKAIRLPLGDKTKYIPYILKSIFSKEFKEEISILKESKRFNSTNVKNLIKTWGYAMYMADFIDKEIKQSGVSDENLVLYSYWMISHGVICAALKRKHPKALFITRAHSYDLYEYRYPKGYIPLRKYIMDVADKILPISKNGEKYIKETYSYLNKEKVETKYLGTIDCGLNAKKDRDNVLNIVSCSSIIPLKRVSRIAQAISLLDFKVRWVHYGDGPLRKETEDMAKTLLDGKDVEFEFKGYTKNSELMDEYRKKHFDLFINVSEIEGLPVSIMEAMSFSIPAIATNVGGTSEITKKGKTGYLLDEDFTDQELADLIRKFKETSEYEKNLMRINCRKVWEENFNADKNFKEFYEFIKEEMNR